MAKVTSKLQVTIPRHVADAAGIAPGDTIEFVRSGNGLRVTLGAGSALLADAGDRLASFDTATRRQQTRQRHMRAASTTSRGWTREQLYSRGRPR
jgi:AbrB family looped-hinge helix DNA binding protein